MQYKVNSKQSTPIHPYNRGPAFEVHDLADFFLKRDCYASQRSRTTHYPPSRLLYIKSERDKQDCHIIH